jgi:hypothetical protein
LTPRLSNSGFSFASAPSGGADRGEILRVRKQKRPAGADPVMEFDLAFGGFSLEIRGDSANLESHFWTSCRSSCT